LPHFWSSKIEDFTPRFDKVCFSARQQGLRDLRKVLETRESAAITRALLSDEDSDEDVLDEYWSNEYERV
jgi:hypothetical protein